MKARYKLYVLARRGGISRDDGIHAEGDYNSDAEATIASYDQVICTVFEGARTVLQKTLCSPCEAQSAELRHFTGAR